MICSGCGAEISAVGSVCPFCRRDKSDDQRHEWAKFLGGAIGVLIGFRIFDSVVLSMLCFIPGYIAGAIYSLVVPAKPRKSSSPRVKSAAGVASPVAVPVEQRSGGDVAEKLTQLKQLHEQGLLTSEEFARKKAEILERL